MTVAALAYINKSTAYVYKKTITADKLPPVNVEAAWQSNITSVFHITYWFSILL